MIFERLGIVGMEVGCLMLKKMENIFVKNIHQKLDNI